jgi:hypothetical protein
MSSEPKKVKWADMDDDEPFNITEFPNIEFTKTDKNGIRVSYVPPHLRVDKKAATKSK